MALKIYPKYHKNRKINREMDARNLLKARLKQSAESASIDQSAGQTRLQKRPTAPPQISSRHTLPAGFFQRKTQKSSHDSMVGAAEKPTAIVSILQKPVQTTPQIDREMQIFYADSVPLETKEDGGSLEDLFEVDAERNIIERDRDQKRAVKRVEMLRNKRSAAGTLSASATAIADLIDRKRARVKIRRCFDDEEEF